MDHRQCFVFMTKEMLKLINSIHKKNADLQGLISALPYSFILRNDAILTENKMSNEIEGIHSSRKELKNALTNEMNKDNRFSALVH